MEADVLLQPNFTMDLPAVLTQLPGDWDMLHLSGCSKAHFLHPYGALVGRGIRPVRSGVLGNPLKLSCPTWAFAYHPKSAAKILAQLRQQKIHLPFDVTLGLLEQHGDIISYTADPWLITSQEAPSQIQSTATDNPDVILQDDASRSHGQGNRHPRKLLFNCIQAQLADPFL